MPAMKRCWVRSAYRFGSLSARVGLAAALLIPPLLLAQSDGSLRGILLDESSNVGIPQARVQLEGPLGRPNPLPIVARSGPNGQFSFTQVLAGRYLLRAEKAGYFLWQYGAEITTTGADLELGKVFITPKREIAGVVRWTDNEPVVSAIVEVEQANAGSADLREASRGEGHSDDHGEFRVGGLRPGKFVVYAYKEAPSTTSRIPQVARPVFYPGATDRKGAAVIDLTSGGAVSPLTFTLEETKGVTVSGHIEPSADFPKGTQVHVAIAVPYIAALPFIDYSTATGREFVFNQVPPRTYELMAFVTAPPGSPKESARFRQELIVKDSPITDLKLLLTPSSHIEGAIEIESTVTRAAITKPAAGLRFRLTTEKFPLWCDWLGSSKQDGHFVMPIAFGSEPYVLTLTPIPEGLYISRVLQQGRDIAGQSLTISAVDVAGPIQVTLKDDGGTVTGTVSSNSRPVSRAFLVLAPDHSDASYWYRTTEASPDGSFRISGIAPGDYQLFAFDRNDDDEYRDPEFRRNFANRASKIHVVSKGNYSSNLELVER